MSTRRKVLLAAILLIGVPAALLGLDHAVRPSITPAELAARLGTATAPVVVDVRTAREFAAGHIPGAVHVPFHEIGRRAQELLTRGDEFVLTCAHGGRASLARLTLPAADDQHVAYLRGHMLAWTDAGLPLETDESP